MTINQATIDRVDGFDRWEFENHAHFAAQQLDTMGFTYIRLSPGDSTSYEFSIIRPPTVGQWTRWERGRRLEPDHPAYLAHPEFNDENRYFVANSFGRLYGWSGTEVHPTYAFEKWTSARPNTPDEHTACVIARFLTAVGEAIRARKERHDQDSV